MYSEVCNNCTHKHCASLKPKKLEHREIMVIGDIPTALEVRKNRCMTGNAVDILKQTMRKVGMPIDTRVVHYTTAIKCAVPKRKGRPIPVGPIRYCTAHIRNEIREVNPKLVLVLGKTATQTVFGDTKLKSTSVEGRVQEIAELPGIMILPVKHPALIMRSPGEYKQFLPSIELANVLYRGGQMHDVGKVEWQVLDTEEKCDKAIEFLRPLKRVSADIETTDLDYRVAEYCVLGIGFNATQSFVVPREMRHRCKDFFALPNIKWTWHHGKYDSKVMWRRMLGAVPHDNDTINQHYMLNETPPHDLGHLTKVFLQAPDYKYKMNQNFKAVTLETYDHFFESLCERVAVDCSYTYQLEDVLLAELEKTPSLKKLYSDFIMPLTRFLSRVEQNGMLINPKHLEEMDIVYDKRLIGIMDSIHQEAAPYWDPELYKIEMGAKSAPPVFNPGSPKQMSWMVFKQLKLKPRIKKGTSTNADVLNSIEPQHPLIEKVLEYRKVKKEQSTYVKGLLKRRDVDGRVRTNFGVHITATGRLSSKEPNLQNIPSYFGVGNVRRAFIARKGYMLMEIDYSGAELRWLACLSKCPVLTNIFVKGLNLHDETSRMLFGENFTPQDRMRAKACNFGIMYGREADSFVDEFNISKEEAEKLVQDWLNAYPGAKKFLEDLAQAVVDGKYIETPFGRRRRFGLVTKQTLHSLQNEARNMPIQSSSSDTLLQAAMDVEDILLEKYDTRIVNLIHDSMLVEIPCDIKVIQAVSQLVSKVMVEMPKKLFGYEVPFHSDSDLGFTWGDLVSYDNEANTVEYKTVIDGKKQKVVEDAQTWLTREGKKHMEVYGDWYHELKEVA